MRVGWPMSVGHYAAAAPPDVSFAFERLGARQEQGGDDRRVWPADLETHPLLPGGRPEREVGRTPDR